MTPTPTPTRTATPLLTLAAAASVAAGIVHAAAAGSHADLPTLASLYGSVAVLQIVWAGAALLRGGTAIVLAGVGLHVAVLATWVASRTVGISFVDGLQDAQTVAFQDGFVAGLQGVAIVAGAASLTSVRPGLIASRAVPVLAAVLLVAAVPASAVPHDGHHGGDADDTHAHEEPAEVVATPAVPVQSAPASGHEPTTAPSPAAPEAMPHIDPPGAPAHGHG